MKATFFIAGMMLSIACFGQRTVNINNIVVTELPKDVESISKEQALTYASNKFKDSKIASMYISGTRAKQIYQIDNFIIYIVTDDHPVKDGHLNEIKRGLDEAFKSNASYTSSLTYKNGNQILITNNTSQGVGVYSFFGNNTDNSQSATGGLIYNLADSAKATAALDHILQNLKFKIQ